MSPYCAFANNPIANRDVDGDSIVFYYNKRIPNPKAGRKIRGVIQDDYMDKKIRLVFIPGKKIDGIQIESEQEEFYIRETWKALEHIYENGSYNDILDAPHPETGQIPSEMGIVDGRTMIEFLANHEEDIQFTNSLYKSKSNNGGVHSGYNSEKTSAGGFFEPPPKITYSPYQGARLPTGTYLPVDLLFHEIGHQYHFLSDADSFWDRFYKNPTQGKTEEWVKRWTSREEYRNIMYNDYFWLKKQGREPRLQHRYKDKDVRFYPTQGSTTKKSGDKILYKNEKNRPKPRA